MMLAGDNMGGFCVRASQSVSVCALAAQVFRLGTTLGASCGRLVNPCPCKVWTSCE